ncbi:hypothetical protein FJ955_03170 [Mesorhizobium sp. B2-2-2]|uniref:hypothetical protein n=1 Tax=Mesorhizobium sp. B2-2-2 TaxID=2589964 RepID=UPI001128FCAB|nr:hypothetical protein [Mesorhizobium sp. B2-2-2]TPM33754.1 hypothetical protein FJ955_03170 [Mesorhizobium sp. B2-2-2]
MTMTAFRDLEPVICDADNMADVMYTLLETHFATPPDGTYVLVEAEGRRLLFLAGILAEMAGKITKAYYEAVGRNAS